MYMIETNDMHVDLSYKEDQENILNLLARQDPSKNTRQSQLQNLNFGLKGQEQETPAERSYLLSTTRHYLLHTAHC